MEPETAGTEMYPIEARPHEMSQGDDGEPPFDLAPEPADYALPEQREGEIPIRPLEEPAIVRRREISEAKN